MKEMKEMKEKVVQYLIYHNRNYVKLLIMEFMCLSFALAMFLSVLIIGAFTEVPTVPRFIVISIGWASLILSVWASSKRKYMVKKEIEKREQHGRLPEPR